MKTKYLVMTVVMVFTITACKMDFNVKIGSGDKLKGEGITFVVPAESGSSSAGDGGIKYNGDSVTANTNGKTLTVNGVDYGSVKRGDVVDLREKGKVLVNEMERHPAERDENPNGVRDRVN